MHTMLCTFGVNFRVFAWVSMYRSDLMLGAPVVRQLMAGGPSNAVCCHPATSREGASPIFAAARVKLPVSATA